MISYLIVKRIGEGLRGISRLREKFEITSYSYVKFRAGIDIDVMKEFGRSLKMGNMLRTAGSN